MAAVRSGTALSAMPATAAPQTVEVGDLKLEVEPSSIVLVNCKQATVADLKEGEKVKASYQQKDRDRPAVSLARGTIRANRNR